MGKVGHCPDELLNLLCTAKAANTKKKTPKHNTRVPRLRPNRATLT